jgi:Icc-related predicted phosphoesterase
LILSGDICVARELPFSDSYKGERFRNFFDRCAKEFPNVIMIAGNHESYHGDIKYTNEILKNAVDHLPNFHVLEKETFVLNDVTFIGGTLWTDMNNQDRHTLYEVDRYMNDFRIIKNSNSSVSFKDEDGNFHTRPSKFSTSDAVQEHLAMLDCIKSVVDGKPDDKFVVVGHHAPSKTSTHPRYADDTVINGGYSSNLDSFIIVRPQIKLWTHGHTHEEFDYVIGDTRIVCNPRGYVHHEIRADEFKLKYVEV